MRKQEVSVEERVIGVIKRTGSDINQLFSELNAELSEEYLKVDDSTDAKEIKDALKIISDQQEDFLAAVKKAVFILKGGTASEQQRYITENDEFDDEI